MNTADCFATIEGRFKDWNYGHPKILYGLIRALRPAVVVEVGTYRGYAACYMARALQENNYGRLHCIDDFSEQGQRMWPNPATHWHVNLIAAGVRHWASLIPGKSSAVQWPDQVDFAYIDGWHGLAQCQWDFEACASRGAELIALDDTQSTIGPKQLLASLRKDSAWDVMDLHSDNGLGLCYRSRRGSRMGRRVEFSQELPNNPGIDMKGMSDTEIREHLHRCKEITGLEYGDVL